AAVVAGATVFLAAAAHTVGGGVLPDPLILAAVLALVLAPVVLLSRRKISGPSMLAVLSAGQLALHEAFGALSVTSGPVPVLAPEGGHVHVLGALSPAHAAGGTHTESPAMMAAHAVATLVTALLLARGEAALWALLSWLRPLVRVLAALRLHPFPALPAFTEESRPGIRPSLRLPTRRGPPRGPAVA
ncbi:MAG: hypothetical protein HOQ07_03625, partial [Sinomonas sp.]|nr:hypothetical protein [Sinomonas sp.]